MIERVMILIVAGFFISIAAWLIGLMSYYAYGRGYNPIVWALAAIIALNPIFLLVVLAIVPHRSRLRLRDQFRAELDAKLAGHPVSVGGGPGEALSLETRTAERHGAQPQRPLDATRTFMEND